MSIIYKKNHLAFLLAIAMFLLVIFGPKLALAVQPSTNDLTQSPITRGLCNVFEMANGNIGKAIAIFAIVAVGFGFFTGKFSIALVIGITLGIGILFGAPKVIAALTGDPSVDCSTVTSGDAEVCPGTLTASFTSLSPFQNTATKAITYSSGATQLMTLECKTYGSGDIRLNIKPLVASGLSARTTIVSDVIDSLTGGTIVGLQVIPNTGSVPITSNGATGNLSATEVANAFCPSVNVDLLVGTANSSSCASPGAIPILFSTASTAASGSNVMCVTSQSVTASSMSTGNVTHKTSLFTEANNGNLTIPAGFKKDVRKMLIVTNGGSSRYLVATCSSGVWVISTTNNTADNDISTNVTSNCSNTTTGIATHNQWCIVPTASSTINLNLVP